MKVCNSSEADVGSNRTPENGTDDQHVGHAPKVNMELSEGMWSLWRRFGIRTDVVRMSSRVRARETRRQSKASCHETCLVVDGRCGSERELVALRYRKETTAVVASPDN